MNKYYYLDVTLEFADSNAYYELTPEYFKNHITQAVQQLFGETVSSIDIDLLKYNSYTKRGIVRIPIDYYVKVRSSLTLCGKYESADCAYRINKASPLLLNLQGDSRSYSH